MRVSKNRQLSLTESKLILNGDGDNFSDEEILEIREWIYRLVEIALEEDESANNNIQLSDQEGEPF